MKRWKIAAVGAAALLCGAMLLHSWLGASVPTVGWGLSFQNEGQTPAGPLSAEKLASLDAAYVDPKGGKVLYLTFDAGYENGYTGEILDILKKQDVPAAFFLVGDFLERNADLVRQMAADGHIVGNHTMNHPDMTKVPGLEAFGKELQAVEELYTDITGQTLPKFYRPPQGLYSEENLKMAKELGYKTVFWSLAYADWDNKNQPDPDASVEKLIRRTHDGAVILLHSTSKTNAQILDRLITSWKDMGYRFAPLTELFA